MKELRNDCAVVLHSGGQDSTTCLYWALQRYSNVYALTFDYGQRHRIEIKAAAAIAESAGVPHTILKLSGLSMLGGSALTDESIPVTNELSESDGLPTAFVPGRNVIFLSYAAAYAYQRDIGVLVTGVCETDYSGYPDCRSNTMRALSETLACGFEARFAIETPLMTLSKAQTVDLAEQVGAMGALALSHTCYNGVFPPCGDCPACVLRARGFAESGQADPLLSRASGSP